MKKQPKKRKRQYPKQQIFVATAVPGQFWVEDVLKHGQVRFYPLGRRQPLDGDEYGRANYRHRVSVAYLQHEEKQFVLGYVWEQQGAGYFRARQPGGPWRGQFKSKQAAAKALRSAFPTR